LDKIKAEKRTRFPAVHLAFLMLRSNFHELKQILPVAKRLGVEQIVASNLTLIVDPRFSKEAIFSDEECKDYYINTLEDLRDKAAREKIMFDYHGPGLSDASPGCRENVHRACVINVEGEVGPCIFTNPLLCSLNAFKDRSCLQEAISFGNIGRETLTRIWNKKEYREFRNLFDPEIAKDLEPEHMRLQMPRSCLKCHMRFGV